jgi:hypothetical protein
MSLENIRNKQDSLSKRAAESDGSSLAPSKIAQQFYCEKKVDLSREHGEIDTPAKIQGSETHEKAAEDSEEISDEEFWNALERGDRQIIVESPFLGEAAEFVIGGYPDAVLFDNGKPQLLFERKTTSRPNSLFENQRIQAWLYGFILDSLGFETDDLRIAILSHEQSIEPEQGKALQEVVLATHDQQDIGSHELMEQPKAILHLSSFDKLDYLEDLNWALGYWRDERDPIPTEIEAKCRSCEYNDLCPDAQI